MECNTPYSAARSPNSSRVPSARPDARGDAPRGCARLEETLATNERSMSLGANILNLLGVQRESLLSTGQTLEASRDRVMRSHGILGNMIQQARSSNLMKLGLIAAL
ncbi:MAG: hypothetical protein SGPRY_005523, partial [Prymnesium sp.]